MKASRTPGPDYPKPAMLPVNIYRCNKCQVTHYEDMDGEIYNSHLYFSTRFGVAQFTETLAQRRQRYEMRWESDRQNRRDNNVEVPTVNR